MSDIIEQEDLIEIELDDVQDDIKIEAKPDGKAPEPKPKTETPEKVDDQTSVVADLRRQLEEERRARAEADNRAQTAMSTAQDSNYTTIVNAIAARETAMVQLEAELANAIETGDGARAAKLQRRINAVDIELDKLNNGKTYLEEQSRQGRAEGRVEPQPQPREQPPEDRKEAILRTVHPRSAEWLRRHPDCLDDPAKNARMMAAHYEAVADNIEPNSDAYFVHIETKLGYRNTPARKEPEVQKDPPPRQQRDPMPAAPAARDMSSGGGRTQTVTLTREERETAESLGIDLKAYARNKLALIREGQLKG